LRIRKKNNLQIISTIIQQRHVLFAESKRCWQKLQLFEWSQPTWSFQLHPVCCCLGSGTNGKGGAFNQKFVNVFIVYSAKVYLQISKSWRHFTTAKWKSMYLRKNFNNVFLKLLVAKETHCKKTKTPQLSPNRNMR